ncbi:hypothetical protein M9H77_11833 [Catharanthus roseus]|uniref:Uncharacterized protein n=1 Tax=Catharanthus roseus TaxID=4058 RepID=A0ACC0BFT1_CATRO|nr:hypothetical protein M9H77_11833 [Catharanthus roseus]
MHKISIKGNLHRSKRLLKTTRAYEDDVIKLNTLKRRRLVRGILKSSIRTIFKSSSSYKNKKKNLLGASSLIIFQRRRKEELVETKIELYLSLPKAYLITLFHPYSSLLSCDQRYAFKNVEEEESEEEQEEETHRREIRQKKRQERAEEGSSSRSMTQLMDMIVSL